MISFSNESCNFCAPKLPDTRYNWNMIIDKLNMILDFWVVTARSFFSWCVVTKEVRKQQCRVRVEVFGWYTAHIQYRGERTRNWTAGKTSEKISLTKNMVLPGMNVPLLINQCRWSGTFIIHLLYVMVSNNESFTKICDYFQFLQFEVQKRCVFDLFFMNNLKK